VDPNENQWLSVPAPVTDPLVLRDAPKPGTTCVLYDQEGNAQGLLITPLPPPRNRREALSRWLRALPHRLRFRWRACLLWRHGIWDA
jgi:hypothetical protein